MAAVAARRHTMVVLAYPGARAAPVAPLDCAQKWYVILKHPTVHPEAAADLMKEVGNNFRSAQSYYEPIIG